MRGNVMDAGPGFVVYFEIPLFDFGVLRIVLPLIQPTKEYPLECWC